MSKSKSKWKSQSKSQSRSSWDEALQRARSIAPPTSWRRELAQAIRLEVNARFVAVFTCPPGAPLAAQAGVSPPLAAPLVRQLQTRFLPELERTGDGMVVAGRLGARAHSPLERTSHHVLAGAVREELLRPAGVRGLLNAFLPGALSPLGWICVGTAVSDSEALRLHGAALTAVARSAGRTLQTSLELAASCGAVAPQRALPACLSPRQKQVASLVAAGLTDLNVATRLGISEETVGTHLREVYRKLALSSRLGLRERLFGGASRDPLFD